MSIMGVDSNAQNYCVLGREPRTTEIKSGSFNRKAIAV